MGNFQAAAIQITQEADKRGNSKGAIIWRLDEGAVLRAAERFEEAIRRLTRQKNWLTNMRKLQNECSREALATVTNLTTLPYEGFAYDKIMMNTYKALNNLQMGDSNKARDWNSAVHFNARMTPFILIPNVLKKAIEEGNKQNYNIDLAKVNRDGKFQKPI